MTEERCQGLTKAAGPVVEEVRQSFSLQDMVATLTTVVQAAATRLRGSGAGHEDDDGDDGQVQRIRVS